jgi:putative transposase
MITFFTTLLRLFLQAFRSKRNTLTENALLKKENEILLRKMGKKKVHFGLYDKLFLVVLNRAADIKRQLTLVKPETVLSWQRTLLKRFWTFEHKPAQRGRKPVDTDVKNLILSMKNDNLLWGVKRIQGELLKLDISLSTKTISRP